MEVYTVATGEISDDTIHNFNWSTQRFGYRTNILGRCDKWQGWSYRTRKYIEALERCTAEVVIICDCTDLFFIAPATEMYESFKADNFDILIAGASRFYDSKIERMSAEYVQLGRFFIHRFIGEAVGGTDRAIFPNGGFLIGYTNRMIELLKLNAQAQDDQSGYHQIIHSGRVPKFNIDYQAYYVTCFVYDPTQSDDHAVNHYWEFVGSRIRNKVTKSKPMVLHFPGRNFKLMRYMFFTLFFTGQIEDQIKDESLSDRWFEIWSLILIIIVVIISIILISTYFD